MILSNVKLVVTDMDGTLLNSKGEVSKRFLDLYRELSSLGVHFIAASGRQYFSISSKLENIKNEITIIAENGGLIIENENELHVKSIAPNAIDIFVKELRKINGVYTILCGINSAYVENSDSHFIAMFNEYYYKYKIVDDLTTVTNDTFLKIASYHFENSETQIYPHLKAFENQFQIKVSGQNWLDISHPQANKGVALKFIQDKMNINPSETMVFGDYNNDLEMLHRAHFSYAMQNAHPNVKAIANFETSSNNDFGVENVLEELLLAKKGNFTNHLK